LIAQYSGFTELFARGNLNITMISIYLDVLSNFCYLSTVTQISNYYFNDILKLKSAGEVVMGRRFSGVLRIDDGLYIYIKTYRYRGIRYISWSGIDHTCRRCSASGNQAFSPGAYESGPFDRRRFGYL